MSAFDYTRLGEELDKFVRRQPYGFSHATLCCEVVRLSHRIRVCTTLSSYRLSATYLQDARDDGKVKILGNYPDGSPIWISTDYVPLR